MKKISENVYIDGNFVKMWRLCLVHLLVYYMSSDLAKNTCTLVYCSRRGY